MGDVADMMLDGTLCGICGVYLGQDWRGIPTLCKACAKHPKTSHSSRREPTPQKAMRRSRQRGARAGSRVIDRNYSLLFY